MMTRKMAWIALLAICVVVACGDRCGVAPTPGTPTGGFPVTTGGITVDSGGNVTSTFTYPGQYVTGGWLGDNTGAAGAAYNFALTTDDNGNGYVNEGRIYANWSSSITWNPSCNGYTLDGNDFNNVNPLIGIQWICSIPDYLESPNTSTHFALPGASPSSIMSYGDFSATYGEPQLRVYVGGSAPGFVSSVSASSVVAGSSATFPFPKQSNGSPLAEGFYSLVNTNVASSGGLVFVDPSYLAVGGGTTLSSAFGVDAADVSETVDVCYSGGSCRQSSSTTSTPILTQYYSGQVTYITPNTSSGGVSPVTLSVGTQPVAAKLYGSYTAMFSHNNGGDTISTNTTFPSNAIVANSGSNSVSLVNFVNNTAVNLAVGAKPMALTLNSASTYAYVANYGSGTLSEVDLSTEAVTRTATGLSGALSVAMDPSGSYVWVGGTNYIYKVSVSTFAVVSSVSVAGSVTSLAASNAQNELVYTLVQNCCSSSSTYAANELLISNLSKPGTYANASASPYASYTMKGTLPTAAALPQATSVVSARFSNGMAASATPTGFVIYDVISHKEIMTGTTPTPVRGIASDPDAMFAYFTLPDSNEYIAVPLESTPN
jgi:hypothetical protein